MDCPVIAEDLSAYVDREVEGAERARIEAHLDECPECVSEVGALRAAKALVSRLRLHEEEAPATLEVLPPAPAETYVEVSWLRQPLRRRYLFLAAAAVLLGLVASYRWYEQHFQARVAQRDMVAAHLNGAASVVLPAPGGGAATIADRPIPPVGEGEVYAVRHGVDMVANHPAVHTVFRVGRQAVSQLRFAPGEFDDRRLARAVMNGRTYRVGQVGAFSFASYQYDHAQIVLVAAGPPEALLLLAQNTPPDTPFDRPTVGY
jgi:hypothetical protein